MVLSEHSGQHHGRAATDPRRPGDPVLVGRAFRSETRSGAGDYDPGLGRALPRLPAGQHVVHLAGLHQPPDLAEQHSGPSGPGRQGPHRRCRPEPGRDQLGGNARASTGLLAVPLAASVARADGGRRANRRAGRLRRRTGRAAVFRAQQDLRGPVARTNRVATTASRGKDAGVTMSGMLEGKVVVISGVGPGLGTTLAHRCARDGAGLVLAARSLDRLEAVAKQINDTGHNAVAVRADITDDEEVAYLVETTMGTYGKVDVLINNAFRVPSMKPLAGTSFQHIRDAIELSALGALRLTQAFTPGLEESHGSIVNVNSMVLRHSQAKYGAYKMAKSALLSMSQSLATELGDKGIRVNSVAPGYIWRDTLKAYFEHQAGKYGTTVDQIYQATAANSDLKRLPTEDEVASALLFLASDLSSGITGQTLDVNCGEYHT